VLLQRLEAALRESQRFQQRMMMLTGLTVTTPPAGGDAPRRAPAPCRRRKPLAPSTPPSLRRDLASEKSIRLRPSFSSSMRRSSGRSRTMAERRASRRETTLFSSSASAFQVADVVFRSRHSHHRRPKRPRRNCSSSSRPTRECADVALAFAEAASERRACRLAAWTIAAPACGSRRGGGHPLSRQSVLKPASARRTRSRASSSTSSRDSSSGEPGFQSASDAVSGLKIATVARRL